MRSSNRNSGNSRALTLAAAAALLLCTAVQGAEAEDAFVFTAYSNAAGGEQLLSGDYQGAAQLTHHPLAVTSSDPSSLSNNRCVALAITKQWEAARVACNHAVRDAEQERSASPVYRNWTRNLNNEYVAIALSNRAVLHYMASEADAAAVDLKRAAAISPTSDFVARNQAALEHSRTAVAQVTVAPMNH